MESTNFARFPFALALHETTWVLPPVCLLRPAQRWGWTMGNSTPTALSVELPWIYIRINKKTHNLVSATLSKMPLHPFGMVKIFFYTLHLKDKLIVRRPQWLPSAPQRPCSLLTQHWPQAAHLSLAYTAISATRAKLQQLQRLPQVRQSSKERCCFPKVNYACACGLTQH